MRSGAIWRLPVAATRGLALWVQVPLFLAAQWLTLLHGQVHSDGRGSVLSQHVASADTGTEPAPAGGDSLGHAGHHAEAGWAGFLQALFAGHDDGDGTCDLMAHIAQAEGATPAIWAPPALPAVVWVAWCAGEARFGWHAQACARGPPAQA